jgi:hypothetical protein
MVERWKYVDNGEPRKVVAASDYDVLAKELEEAVGLLHGALEIHDTHCEMPDGWCEPIAARCTAFLDRHDASKSKE